MLGTAWLTLRQVQEALRNGRLEEAQRLLGKSGARDHKRSWELLRQVGHGYVERGERRLGQGDPEAAWQDLLHAEQSGARDSAANLRQGLAQRALADVRGRLEAGEPVRALEAIGLLRERLVQLPELQALEEVAKDWIQARELADKGDFAPALQTVERLRTAWPQLAAVQSFQGELERRRDTVAAALLKVHAAVAERTWRVVIPLADEVLAAAPHHAEARQARARAWQAIEPSTVGDRAAKENKTPAPVSTTSTAEPASRYLLWIDGIGGYLICMGPRVTIGQAVPDATVDVPLFADVSRLHATLTRDAEGYLLEAVRSMQVNGQVTERALLQANDRVTLGGSCQVQFRQPVPVSASARLDIVSGHRLALAVDAVLMMADTLVLGPSSQAHESMPDLRQPIVLFRQKNSLGIRFAGKFAVDGQRCTERGSLKPTSMVSGDGFTFAIEPAGTGMGRS